MTTRTTDPRTDHEADPAPRRPLSDLDEPERYRVFDHLQLFQQARAVAQEQAERAATERPLVP
jgi:hypothetical protein